MEFLKEAFKAYQIMNQAHHGQVDKAGKSYKYHPIHVALQMRDKKSFIAALLHDVIEDSSISADDLIQIGISEEIVEAVVVLNHKRYEPYMDYIERVSKSEIARKVKLADLAHNSDLSRLPEISEKYTKRAAKYAKAIDFLSQEE